MRKRTLLALLPKQLKTTFTHTVFFLFLVTTVSAYKTAGQDPLLTPVNVSVSNMEIGKVISILEAQAKVKFIYSPSVIQTARKISCSAANKKLGEFLDEVFRPLSIAYKTSSDKIILFSSQPQKKSTSSVTEQMVQPDVEVRLNQVDVSGFIKDENGTALQGVTVTEKGTKNTTVTDASGRFSIRVKDALAVLVFSSVGFTSREMAVGQSGVLSVELASTSKMGEEVIIVGYGKQKKVNSTGAISTISTKELVQSPVANVTNSLVGRTSGIFATQSGGEPGNDASKIRIRGVGTFSGNTDPLTLVDGIEVATINNIDPNEIESITILKDAASTAVYGIRGANGVIIVTTKRGKTGPPRIGYSFNQGINSFTNLREPMNAADYARANNIALQGDAYVTGSVYVPRFTATDIELYRNGTDPVFHPNSNWSELLFRKTSLQQQHNLNISGGQRKVRYFISGGYFTQEGLFKDMKDIVDDFSPQSTFNRINLRSNFNFDLTERFKMALDFSTQFERRSGNTALSTERVIGNIMKASPIDGPGVVDGKIVDINTSNLNPYISLLSDGSNFGLRRNSRSYLNGQLRGDYDLAGLTKGLSIYSSISVQTFNALTVSNLKGIVRYQAFRLADGSINYVPNTTETQFNFSQTGTYNRRVTGEAGINYRRSFGDHNVTGLVLYNQQKTTDPNLAFLVPKAYQSLAGRATYDFRGRYLAELNIAYNGTENFAPGKRFGVFPAYSLGWVASNESFFPKRSFITFLKFRGSYGEVGNDNIGGTRFLYRPTSYSSFATTYYFGSIGTNFAGFTGIREGATGNPNVTWERSVKRNLGIEIRLLNDKLRVNGDLFDEQRNNILAVPQTISAISGLTQPATNLGRMQNKGFEFDAAYSDNFGELNYRIGGNYSFARNKILYTDEIPPIYAYQARTGRRLGQNFGLIADGIYNTWDEVNDAKRPLYATSLVTNNRVQPGDLRFRDVNGDGIINDFDAVPIGYSNLPEITYGVNFGLSYKGLDLSALFQGAGNVSHYYSRFQRAALFAENPSASAASYLTKSWTAERYAQGLPIEFPRFTAARSPNDAGSTFYLADASYLRLKNVELGYTFRQNGFFRKVGVSSARLYANANNLYTWSKMYPGIDPENTATGDNNSEPYPLVRTINAGININF